MRTFVSDENGQTTVVEDGRTPAEFSMRTEFQIGLGIDREGTKISPVMADLMVRHCIRAVSMEYGGATAIRHIGGWITPEDKYMSEPGITIVAYGFKSNMRQIAQKLLDITNQRALILATIGSKVTAMEVFRN